MPYEIRQVEDGYKVFIKNSNKSFSNESLTKEQAEKQLIALNINTDKTTYFENKLKQQGIDPELYLQITKYIAQDNNYNPKNLYFSDKDNYKMVIITPDNHKVYFGAPDYPDYIIYSILESKGEYPKGHARERRRNYLARSAEIKGRWKADKYSPNRLARAILW